VSRAAPPGPTWTVVLPLLLLLPVTGFAGHPTPLHTAVATAIPGATDSSVSNFTSAIQRIVTLLGLSGSGLLAIVWSRVALSWFSNDVSKKVQAKERARDALIGTILFTSAVSGLLFGLAHWVVTGA
jgi:hypothetical protein